MDIVYDALVCFLPNCHPLSPLSISTVTYSLSISHPVFDLPSLLTKKNQESVAALEPERRLTKVETKISFFRSSGAVMQPATPKLQEKKTFRTDVKLT